MVVVCLSPRTICPLISIGETTMGPTNTLRDRPVTECRCRSCNRTSSVVKPTLSCRYAANISQDLWVTFIYNTRAKRSRQTCPMNSLLSTQLGPCSFAHSLICYPWNICPSRTLKYTSTIQAVISSMNYAILKMSGTNRCFVSIRVNQL